MIKFLVIIATTVLIATVVILGIGTYLAPDGLSHCKVQPSGEADCTRVDAIVAISGGDTQARTAQAIALYKNDWADLLVFSGAAQDKTGPSNAEAMKRQALAEGIPGNNIVIDEMSETTKQNAANATDLFQSKDITSVILVTSAYHQRRAGLEFGERAGATIKIINHPVTSDNQWSPWWWTTPTGWWLAISELFKIVAFYLGGSR